jgi:hypothetical protein
MATERVATLSIGVEASVERVRRTLEEFRQEQESRPMKLMAEYGGTRKGTTFGGVETVGPGASVPAVDRPPVSQPARSDAISEFTRARAISAAQIGGTNPLGASPGIVSTAAYNTVYGGVSAGVRMTPAGQAVTSSSFNPTTTAAMEKDRIRAMRRDDEIARIDSLGSLTIRQFQKGEKLKYERDFEAATKANASPAAQAAYERSRQSYFDASAYESPAAGELNSPTTPVATAVRGRTQPGGVASGAIFGIPQAATRLVGLGALAYVGGSAIERTATSILQTREANRLDSPSQIAESVLSEARQRGAASRAVIGAANFVSESSGFGRAFVDADSATDLFRRARGSEVDRDIKRDVRQINASAGLIGREGLALQAGQIREAERFQVEGLRAEQIRPENQFATASFDAKILAVQNRADREFGQAVKDFSNALKDQGGRESAIRVGTERAFFRESEINLKATQAAETRQLEKSIIGLDPDLQRDARFGLDQIQGAQRARLNADARFENEQSSLGILSQAQAARLASSGRPLDAQILSINRSFGEQIARTDLSAPGGRSVRDSLVIGRGEAVAAARADFEFAGNLIGVAQRGEQQSIARRLARDPIGASAFAIAAGGEGEILGLQRQGRQGEAEQARANTLSRLQLVEQDYAFSFRGEQFDAQNLLINSPRDSQDPGEVFSQIDAARQQVEGANANLPSSNMKELTDQIIRFVGQKFDELLQAVN